MRSKLKYSSCQFHHLLQSFVSSCHLPNVGASSANVNLVWPVMTRCDHLWTGVTRCDQMRQGDQVWPEGTWMTRCDQVWPDVTGITICDQMWWVSPGLIICDQLGPDVTGMTLSDQVWPDVIGMTSCDHLWRDEKHKHASLVGHYHLVLLVIVKQSEDRTREKHSMKKSGFRNLIPSFNLSGFCQVEADILILK